MEINEIRKQLECPVCSSVPESPPIYQCSEGHLLCSFCKEKLKICPQCQIPCINNRHRMAEFMLEKLPKIPCENQSGGCQHKCYEENLQEHLKVCEFKFRCNYLKNGCKQSFRFDFDKNKHKSQCGYQKVKCFECSNELYLHKLTDHLINNHPSMTAFSSDPDEANFYFCVKDKSLTDESKYLAS